MKTSLVALFFFVFLVLSPSSVYGQEPAPEPTQIVYGLHQEPDTLNPFVTRMGVSGEVTSAILEPLIATDPESNLYPVLAKELPNAANGGVSADGLTITFRLREDIVWSDGEPFTCDDVLFTYEAATDPTNDPAGITALSLYDAVTCQNDFTAVAHLRFPVAGATEFFDARILPRHVIVDAQSMAEWAFNGRPVGTGPFRFVEWVAGDHITLDENELYRGQPAAPNIARLVFRFVPPGLEALESLNDREIDMLWNSPAPPSSAPITLDPAIVFHRRPGGFVEQLVLNLADPTIDATDDPGSHPHWALGQQEVRQAIEYAIDKQAFVDGIVGAVEVGATQLTQGWAACKIEPKPYDPERANALLEEAGWSDQNGDGVRECTTCPHATPGAPLRLTIATTAGNVLRKAVQEDLAAMLAQVGIELVAENRPANEFFGSWSDSSSPAHGNFDILMYANNAGLDPAGLMWADFHSSQLPTAANEGQGSNLSRWVDDVTDAALIEAGSTKDREQRKIAFQTMCERIAEGAPHIYLYERAEMLLAYDDIQGVELNPFGPESWNVAEWRRGASTDALQELTPTLSIAARYSIPLTLHVVVSSTLTQTDVIELAIDLDAATLTLLSGDAVLTSTLTITPAVAVTNGASITVTIGDIRQTALDVAAPISQTEAAATDAPETTEITGVVNRDANLRGGPGTSFPVVGSVKNGETVTLVGRSEDGTWYQRADERWLAAFLVDGVEPETLDVVGE